MHLMYLDFEKYLNVIRPSINSIMPINKVNDSLVIEHNQYLSSSDFELKKNLHADIFKPNYDVLEYLTKLTNSFRLGNGCGFILKDNNAPIGSVDYEMINDFVYILNLGVIEEFRGKGLSKLLLSFCIDDVIDKYSNRYQGIYLTVNKSNYKAQNLYNSFGFELKD